MDALFNDYSTILSDLKISSFNLEEDKYSGRCVFTGSI